MKISAAAVPTLLESIRCALSCFKDRAVLQGPNITLCIGGFQRRILTPALFHFITLLQAKMQ
ncbi:MAG: hypothetical protein VB111_06250 [Clostridiaceae bacterium]|nr:hypothetical protein [Clostridiaceae bacterium]